MATRMRRASNDPFAHNVEALERQSGFRRVPNDYANLRLRVDHVDMRDVARDIVLRSVCSLHTQHEPVTCGGERVSYKKGQKAQERGFVNFVPFCGCHNPTILE